MTQANTTAASQEENRGKEFDSPELKGFIRENETLQGVLFRCCFLNLARVLLARCSAFTGSRAAIAPEAVLLLGLPLTSPSACHRFSLVLVCRSLGLLQPARRVQVVAMAIPFMPFTASPALFFTMSLAVSGADRSSLFRVVFLSFRGGGQILCSVNHVVVVFRCLESLAVPIYIVALAIEPFILRNWTVERRPWPTCSVVFGRQSV
jgi:hypothetical protein